MTDCYAERRRRLWGQTETDAYLVFALDRVMPAGMDLVSLRYLTGYTGEGALLVTEDNVLLMTDSRYLEQAEMEVPEAEVVHAESDYLDDLARLVRVRGFQRVGYSAWRATDFVVSQLKSRVQVEWVAYRDPVADLRTTKDKEELRLLRRALEIAEGGLERLVPSLRPGANEVDVAFELVARLQTLGADGALGPTVASGENSALPHYVPSLGRRTLREGDLLLIDFGARVNGYVSDITRTFVIGKATAKQREIYALVGQAVDEGLAALRPGVSGAAVHAAAARVIEESPYAEHSFLSPVGHGVGLEVHEYPRMGPTMVDAVQPGMVVTMEPGIYVPGYGGVRIEETAVVTETGCEVLNGFPRSGLVELPG